MPEQPEGRLFSPLELRGVVFRNRICVSPMCQYSCEEGLATDWHLVHLGSRAVGGAALVMAEATAVSPEGRISPFDMGLWSDAHEDALRRIASFVRGQGAVAGVQLAHAGRKASTGRPWNGGRPLPPSHGGWQPVAPSPIPFDAGYPTPEALSPAGIEAVVRQFREAATRARDAGFQVIEIHAAHGYLLHQFLSPLTNFRDDEYGGKLENRMRLTLDVVEAVRSVWPPSSPLFLRLSATDWVEGGWDLEQSVELSTAVKERGVDLVDCSSGGTVPNARVQAAPGYQVRFAASIRGRARIPTAAVGLITEPAQADQVIVTGQADAVMLARQLLRDPYWPLHAARTLGADVPWPPQYLRAQQ
ncbi:MAG: NADH:flavin oxidoreductase/NADH oxidase [Vicinamibacterales bacterium]